MSSEESGRNIQTSNVGLI